MPYDAQGRWIEENEWEQMMREQAAQRVGAFSRYNAAPPSLYPNQAAPYGSFPYADPTPPIWDSSQKRLRQDVPADPKYQGWDFNQEPIADTSAISNVPFAGLQTVSGTQSMEDILANAQKSQGVKTDIQNLIEMYGDPSTEVTDDPYAAPVSDPNIVTSGPLVPDQSRWDTLTLHTDNAIPMPNMEVDQPLDTGIIPASVTATRQGTDWADPDSTKFGTDQQSGVPVLSHNYMSRDLGLEPVSGYIDGMGFPQHTGLRYPGQTTAFERSLQPTDYSKSWPEITTPTKPVGLFPWTQADSFVPSDPNPIGQPMDFFDPSTQPQQDVGPIGTNAFGIPDKSYGSVEMTPSEMYANEAARKEMNTSVGNMIDKLGNTVSYFPGAATTPKDKLDATKSSTALSGTAQDYGYSHPFQTAWYDHPYLSSEDAMFSQGMKQKMDYQDSRFGGVGYSLGQPFDESAKLTASSAEKLGVSPSTIGAIPGIGKHLVDDDGNVLQPASIAGTVAQTALPMAGVQQDNIPALVDDIVERTVLNPFGFENPLATSALANPDITAMNTFAEDFDEVAFGPQGVGGFRYNKPSGTSLPVTPPDSMLMQDFIDKYGPVQSGTRDAYYHRDGIVRNAAGDIVATPDATYNEYAGMGQVASHPGQGGHIGGPTDPDITIPEMLARQDARTAAAPMAPRQQAMPAAVTPAPAPAPQPAGPSAAEIERQKQAAINERLAQQATARQQQQQAAAQAQAASAAQAQAAIAKAQAVLAQSRNRDRGGPSQREINAAREVLSQIDTFDSGGREHGGFDPQGGTTGSSGMGDWT